ncbi:C45 family autoproteolytic acyltransferase/hydolase [Zhihengliuella halotolerans]|uniref:C45 family autoproteolytic acyltransferase/hydolase n=1 Tax=Zhihengliuella halotolerans TaxID=370736 RepID=UPI000C800CE2|nr:C45 family peptidase [Zhihengliuella halotolerans]
MRLHTLVTSTTDPAARGRLLADAFGSQIRRNVADYLGHFAAKGIEADTVRSIAVASHDALRAWDEPLAVELDAQADALGIERWQLAALNARTEVLAAAPPSREGECSTAVVVRPGAAPATLQTWDWHPHLAADGLLHELTTGNRGVKLFAEFGMSGKIGVNSDGLGVHFNILSHQEDHTGGGVSVHSIARSVLERAATLEEAVALTADVEVSASTVLTVVEGGAAPRAASIEFSPRGRRVVSRTEDGWVLHTNHFLAEDLHDGDTMPADSTTAERFAYLREATSGLTAATSADLARGLACPAGGESVLGMRPDPAAPAIDRWESLLTIGLDVRDFALIYSTEDPDTAAISGFDTF